MNVPFVDLHVQYLSIKNEIDAAIADVLNRTAFIGGQTVKQWESAFADWLGVPHCIPCANGTDSLEILLSAYGIGPGDEVIVPAHSWISTAECVSTVGATPVFVDTLPQYYTIDPSKIEEKITPKTKAIIPVHIFGLPAEMSEIMALAETHHLIVIEDCAQAHGATYFGRKVGTIGHAGSFSFYPGKNLGAYGDAGSMVTSDPEIADKARKIANHGQLVKHQHFFPGRNSRLDGLQAAILLTKLPYLDQWTTMRQAKAASYTGLLASSGLQLPKTPEYASHVYHLYVVQTNKRDALQKRLKENGIASGIHYPTPLPLLDAYQELGYTSKDIPVCAAYTPNILSIPIYPELTEEMIQHVAHTLDQHVYV